MFLRKLLVIFLIPFVRNIARKTRKRNTLAIAEYNNIKSLALPGDIVVTNKRHSITSILIPGRWSHAALISLRRNKIIHAIYPKVEESYLVELVLNSTEIALLRPIFLEDEENDRIDAVQYAKKQIGKPYDLAFEHSISAFYCSELIWHTWKKTVRTWNFVTRKRLGVPTITPTDLYLDRKCFVVIYQASI